MKVDINYREAATIIAALRRWQREGGAGAQSPEQAIATDLGRIKPLDEAAIDHLCVRMNVDDIEDLTPQGKYSYIVHERTISEVTAIHRVWGDDADEAMDNYRRGESVLVGLCHGDIQDVLEQQIYADKDENLAHNMTVPEYKIKGLIEALQEARDELAKLDRRAEILEQLDIARADIAETSSRKLTLERIDSARAEIEKLGAHRMILDQIDAARRDVAKLNARPLILRRIASARDEIARLRLPNPILDRIDKALVDASGPAA